MANTTWNPANLSGVTLSGGNLTATGSSSAGTWWVKAVDVKASGAGKFYWEMKATAWASGNTGLGFCPSALATPSGSSHAGLAMIDRNGAIWVNGSFTSISLTGGGANAVIGIALDLVGKLVWYRVAPSGNWNNSGTANPGTGAGGISVSAITGIDAVPLATLGSGVTDVVVANFGDTAFSGAVPSGFTAGWPSSAAPNYVDFAGNLGGVSSFGKLSYGVKHYSRVDAFAPALAVSLSISPGDEFSGDLAPVVSFSGDVGGVWGLSSDLAPSVTFAADLIVIGFVDFVSDLAPQVALGASLAVDVALTVFEGGLTPNVALGASSFISGPLWADAVPCPAPPWMASEPCPPASWIESAPCPPVVWNKSGLCNG